MSAAAKAGLTTVEEQIVYDTEGKNPTGEVAEKLAERLTMTPRAVVEIFEVAMYKLRQAAMDGDE